MRPIDEFVQQIERICELVDRGSFYKVYKLEERMFFELLYYYGEEENIFSVNCSTPSGKIILTIKEEMI